MKSRCETVVGFGKLIDAIADFLRFRLQPSRSRLEAAGFGVGEGGGEPSELLFGGGSDHASGDFETDFAFDANLAVIDFLEHFVT